MTKTKTKQSVLEKCNIGRPGYVVGYMMESSSAPAPVLFMNLCQKGGIFGQIWEESPEFGSVDTDCSAS